MTIRLNQAALTHANGLIRRGEIVHDERDDWSEHAPSASQSTAFIEKEGIADYAKWHLGEDTEKGDGTKGRYLFPYGDFTKIHRCAVVSGESRAGQYNHAEIEKALKKLLSAIDKKAD